jgi:hypothetical protein
MISSPAPDLLQAGLPSSPALFLRPMPMTTAKMSISSFTSRGFAMCAKKTGNMKGSSLN